MEGDMTWGGEHTIQCTENVIELYTRHLYNFINPCHPNKVNENCFKNFPGRDRFCNPQREKCTEKRW